MGIPGSVEVHDLALVFPDEAWQEPVFPDEAWQEPVFPEE